MGKQRALNLVIFAKSNYLIKSFATKLYHHQNFIADH